MEEFKALMVRVSDGDTATFASTVRPNEPFVSRVKWIDCPEISHITTGDPIKSSQYEWGIKSKTFLANLITNKPIKFIKYGLDNYNRVLGDWYVLNYNLSSNVQYQLVSNGLAVPFLPFGTEQYKLTSRQITLYCGLIRASTLAYQKNLGFWTDYKTGAFVLPGDFKKYLAANP